MRESIKAVEYKENLCFKCLCECENIHTYELKERGYGSIFDGDKGKLQLCDKCNDVRLEEYFNEEPEMVNEYCQEYKYEEEIEKFIKTLPIKGQELFYNQCMGGWDNRKIDSQDWIDIEIGVATDEIYARNDMYTPSEIQAYKDRFPNCMNVHLEEGEEGYYTECKHGAFGDKNGDCKDECVTDFCYSCKNYKSSDEQNDDINNYELWLKANDLVNYAEALKEFAKSGDKENCILSMTDEIKTIVSSIEEIAASEA